MSTTSDKSAVTYTPSIPTGSECDDRAMIDYALRWVNSGGGPETDIESRFDMPGRVFYRSVLAILERCSDTELGALGVSPVLATRIAAVARRRVWISS
ncbi:hypothetical protein ACIGGF_10680 [Rhodococcus sp. NPDC078407]|uniref:hypothetical protein n=1 Tax=Rhodococcus sp. NPDC078407 TaxID=3364509 RepID=UPI0037C52FF8